MSGNAKLVCYLPGSVTDAALYQLDPPLSGSSFVVVSAMEGDVGGMPAETFIFSADEHGHIIDWQEPPGSCRGFSDHAVALAGAGYEVIA